METNSVRIYSFNLWTKNQAAPTKQMWFLTFRRSSTSVDKTNDHLLPHHEVTMVIRDSASVVGQAKGGKEA